MKPVMGKEVKMNRAESMEPKSGHKAPAASHGGSEVGGESKADMKGALGGSPEDKNPLRGATRELHSQHPHEYHEHGPHHGTRDHIRHEPVGKVYGR